MQLGHEPSATGVTNVILECGSAIFEAQRAIFEDSNVVFFETCPSQFRHLLETDMSRITTSPLVVI